MKDSFIWLRTFEGQWAVQWVAGAPQSGAAWDSSSPSELRGAVLGVGQLVGKGWVFGCSSLELVYEAVGSSGVGIRLQGDVC